MVSAIFYLLVFLNMILTTKKIPFHRPGFIKDGRLQLQVFLEATQEVLLEATQKVLLDPPFYYIINN